VGDISMKQCSVAVKNGTSSVRSFVKFRASSEHRRRVTESPFVGARCIVPAGTSMEDSGPTPERHNNVSHPVSEGNKVESLSLRRRGL